MGLSENLIPLISLDHSSTWNGYRASMGIPNEFVPWQFPLQRIPQLDETSKMLSLPTAASAAGVPFQKGLGTWVGSWSYLLCHYATVISETFWSVRHAVLTVFSLRSTLHMRICLRFDHQLNAFNLASPQNANKHSACEAKDWPEGKIAKWNCSMIMPVKPCQSDFLSRSGSSSRLTSKHQRRHDLILVHLKMFWALIPGNYWPRLAPILLWRKFCQHSRGLATQKVCMFHLRKLVNENQCAHAILGTSSWTFMNIESNMTWCWGS